MQGTLVADIDEKQKVHFRLLEFTLYALASERLPLCYHMQLESRVFAAIKHATLVKYICVRKISHMWYAAVRLLGTRTVSVGLCAAAQLLRVETRVDRTWTTGFRDKYKNENSLTLGSETDPA